MGRYIIKIKDKFFEWSTIVDAPTTYGMSHEELFDHIRITQGEEGLRVLPQRLERVSKTGASARDCTLDDLISGNRAGDNETKLTIDEIYEQYGKVTK